uniref:Uncharacterized protein n=1 Tax=Ditylenchus dipsaci TaxID=166011 RepID=A0A915EC58_9BILA
MSTRRHARDTAKDIILGAEPSGRGPRPPREAISVPMTRSVASFTQELAAIKNMMDRQASDIMTINNEVRSRPTVDPKLASTTQLLDSRLREMHNQLIQVKQSMDTEITERIKANRAQADLINRLQEYIRAQEANKNDILSNIARKSDLDRERLTEETKRLNDRIQQIAIDFTKGINDREQKLRDELLQKYNTVQASVKSQLESRSTLDAEMQKRNDERKLHEKGLLNTIDDVELRLNNYLSSLSKTVDEVKLGVDNIRIPVLDTDAVNFPKKHIEKFVFNKNPVEKDMESIAADKTKLSMEGLLKLEERISRIQHGLSRDRRELHYKLGEAIEKDVSKKLMKHVGKLDSLMEEIEEAQRQIRDKVERQIPEDLTELSSKVDNLKAQLTQRVDQEEEERYLAIKELQEAYGKIASGASGISDPGGPGSNSGPVTSTTLKRDVEECKVAIKKLAESVTTVKNVLDRKVQEEIRKREQDVEVLSSRLDSLTIQGLQQQR